MQQAQKFVDEITENGFAVIPNLLSPEQIQKCRDEIEYVFDQAFEANNLPYEKISSLDEKFKKLKSLDRTVQGRVYDLLPFVDCIAQVSATQLVLDIAKGYFQTPTLLIDKRRVRIDDDTNERSLPIHQEGNMISKNNLTLWMPLSDVEENTGAIKVIPGSHKKGYLRHKFYKDGSYNGIVEEDLDIENIQTLPIKAGHALFFLGTLNHGSGPNLSPRVRWTFIMRFNAVKGVSYLREEFPDLRIPYQADMSKI